MADELPSHPPRPGDPRDPGPRPAGRPRDVLWLALGVTLIAITLVQLVALVRVLVREELPPLGPGGLLLGFAITVVWLLTISWFALGSWRRTVWGCPFSHTQAAPAARRCVRHPLVDATDRDPAGPAGADGPGTSGSR